MFIRLGLEDIKVVCRDFGQLIRWCSFLFIIPLLVALIYDEPFDVLMTYILVGLLTFFIGTVISKLCRTSIETDVKHAFMVTVVFWIAINFLTALPFVLIMGMTYVDSFFESISALTTTGLSLMPPIIDSAPMSLIFWRSLLAWIGGVGIIVLAMIGVLTTYTKSVSLITAEGRDQPIKPNLRNAIKFIWSLYLALTLIGTILLFVSGMNFFDSLNYSMLGISTTGMTTTQLGLNTQHNILIDISLFLIMLAGSISFSVHYFAFKSLNPLKYLENTEVRLILFTGITSALLLTTKLSLFTGTIIESFFMSIFHSFATLTTGGFTLLTPGEIFSLDEFTKLAFTVLMIIGASAGSTGGGIKISRAWLYAKSVSWQIKKLVLPPNTFFQKTFEGRVVKTQHIQEITQFILIYIGLLVLGTFVLVAHGYDLSNSLFEVSSAQSNVGITTGITNVAAPFFVKLMLILNMWIGRLEIIPILAGIGFILSLKESRL